jgi:SMC interacting uncharacterized protein involved in chromosome segregation
MGTTGYILRRCDITHLCLAHANWRKQTAGPGDNQREKTTNMMQLDEILEDLKTRKINLTKLKKEIGDDKTKAGILDSITDLVAKIDPLVKETSRLTDVKKNVNKFSNDVDTLNAKRKQLINTFNTLKKTCDSVKKDDTKTKDFGGISDDAASYVALNDFEKT